MAIITTPAIAVRRNSPSLADDESSPAGIRAAPMSAPAIEPMPPMKSSVRLVMPPKGDHEVTDNTVND